MNNLHEDAHTTKAGNSPVEGWKRSLLKGLLFIFPFSFSLDFKGEDGGTLAQVIMAIGAVTTFLFIFLIGSLKPTKPTKWLLLSTICFIGIGCMSAVYHQVPFERIVRIVILFWLFFAGVWAGTLAMESIRTARRLVMAMVFSGLISIAFRYYYATGVTGLEMSEMRYQVLSPAICSLLAFACASFCFMTKFNFISMLTAAAATTMIAISVTRSFVFTFIFTVAGVALIVFRTGWNNPVHRKFILWRKIGLVFVLSGSVVGLLFAYKLRPDLLESWTGRLYAERVVTLSGYDVNYITRVAEISGIWDQVSADLQSLLFGLGFGNSYQWDYNYSAEVGSVSSDMVYAFFVPTWHTGHSPFTYALFFGGIPALIWQTWIFLFALWSGWRLLLPLRRAADSDILQLHVFNLLSVWLLLSQSLTSNPMGERLSAQFLGISVAMLLGMPKLLPLLPNMVARIQVKN